MSDEEKMQITSPASVSGYEYDMGMEEREEVSRYLDPDTKCLLCSADRFSYEVNRDWLDGTFDYAMLAKKHNAAYRKLSGGQALTKVVLGRHFTKHMNAVGAAINTWTKRQARRADTEDAKKRDPTPEQRKLFDLLKRQYLDKMDAIEYATREMIATIDEMDKEIEDKRDAGRTMDIDRMLEKKHKMLLGLQSNLLKSVELDSKLELDHAHLENMKVLDFIMLQGAGIMDASDPRYLGFVKDAERLWMGVAMKQIVARLGDALEDAELDHPTRSKVLTALKANMKGAERSVKEEYEREARMLKDNMSSSPRIVDEEREP